MADCISERRSKARQATRWVAGLTLAVACAGANINSTPVKVTAVRFWSLGDVTRIAIEVSSEFRYRSDHLNDPERIFFDIQGAKPEMVHKGMHVIAVGDALVKQIRVAETHPGVTRIVLDLEQAAVFTASQLSRPDRLMIEVRKESPGPPAVRSVTAAKTLTEAPLKPADADVEREIPTPMPALAPTMVMAKPEPRKFRAPPERPAPPRPAVKPVLLSQPMLSAGIRIPKAPLPAANMPKKVLPAPKTPAAAAVVVAKNTSGPAALPSFDSLQSTAVVAAPAKTTIEKADLVAAKTTLPEPAPAKRNANGERSLTRVLGLKLGRVVIDPGHGGHDKGTHGPSGLLEKEVVLDVAKRLVTLLEDRLGSEVIYTRTDDTFIPLERRTQMANEGKADLFLSIHANSSPYKYVAGVETYYLNFTTVRAALDTATRENASSSRSVFELKDLLQKIALKDKIDESRDFAAKVESALYGVSSKSNPSAKNRGVKKAPFVVLIGASMPSVLAEIGFLTNTNDELMLKRPDHREKIAEALYKGIANYADTLSHFQVAKRSD
jgi:N-acetylmuramoyl-L-alanine amidase